MRCTIIQRSLQCPYMYESKSGSRLCCTLKAGWAAFSGMKISALKGAQHNPMHGKWWWLELTSWSPCQTPAASASPSCKTVLLLEPVEHSSRGQSVLLKLFIEVVIDWTCRQGTVMLIKMEASQRVCCQRPGSWQHTTGTPRGSLRPSCTCAGSLQAASVSTTVKETSTIHICCLPSVRQHMQGKSVLVGHPPRASMS